MAHVAYRGPSDSRTLTAADMKKLGVEDFTKTTFQKGENVEVPDKAAEVLTSHKALRGQFVQQESEDADAPDDLQLEFEPDGGHDTQTDTPTTGTTSGGSTTGTTSGTTATRGKRTRSST
jgi:hypothetical protein